MPRLSKEPAIKFTSILYLKLQHKHTHWYRRPKAKVQEIALYLLIPRQPAIMKITVTTLTDKIFFLDVSEDLELENFKAFCEVESGISGDQMLVVFNSKPLMDNKKPLKHFGIKDGDCVLLQKVQRDRPRPQGNTSNRSAATPMDLGKCAASRSFIKTLKMRIILKLCVGATFPYSCSFFVCYFEFAMGIFMHLSSSICYFGLLLKKNVM